MSRLVCGTTRTGSFPIEAARLLTKGDCYVAYTIPNEVSAFDPNQAEPDGVDFDILASSLGRNGVVKGLGGELAVTHSGGADLKFRVATGDIWSNGNRLTHYPLTTATYSELTLGAAHATLLRFDLIVITIAGAPAVRAGTANANPVFPALTAGDVCLAAIFVPAAETTSAANRITDKRMLVADQPLTGKFGSLGLYGHSYLAGPNQPSTGVSGAYRETVGSRLMALLGIHQDNVDFRGHAGSTIGGNTGLFATLFGGWPGIMQFVLPDNSAPTNAAADIVVTDPIVACNAAAVVIHGVNDFLMAWSAIDAENAVRAANNVITAKQAYRAVISRLRSGVVFCSVLSNAAVTWDASVAFGGSGAWADLPATLINTGAAIKYNATVGGTVTITLPVNFTGGVVSVNILGLPAGVTHLTAGISNAAGQVLALASKSHFGSPTSGTITVKISGPGGATEEILVDITAGGATWTCTTRGVNGTAAVAHGTDDIVQTAPDTMGVNWTGTVAAATGQTLLSGQGSGQPFGGAQYVMVTKRFVCTGADAGKTIVGTVFNNVPTDLLKFCLFDSWQIEAPNPPPVVIANLHDFDYANAVNPSAQQYIAPWNTMINAIVAEFTDGFVRVADVNTPFYNRNGVFGSALTADFSGTATGVSHTTITDTGKNWPTNTMIGNTVTMGGRTLVITSNTTTVLTGSAGWQGGADPSAGAYTIDQFSYGVVFTANHVSFAPVLGMAMRNGGEIFIVTAVAGTAPNWTLTLKRAQLGTPLSTHASGAWLGPCDWMHTDGVHLNSRGHAVYAETIYRTFQSMPTPSAYQIAEIQGVWAQDSQSLASGIYDNGFLYANHGSDVGVRGAVTQITSRATGVTMVPNPCTQGQIQTVTTSLAAGALADFVVTNSAVAVGDIVLLSMRSGWSAGGNTEVLVVGVGAGTFTVRVANRHASQAETGAIIIDFTIIKSVEAVGTLNKQFAIPIDIPKTCVLIEMGVRVTTFANATGRFGLYLPDGNQALPQLLLQETGSGVSLNTTNGIKTIACMQILKRGRYWVSFAQQGSVAATLETSNSPSPQPYIMTNAAFGAGVQGVIGISQTGISGPFATWGAAPIWETAPGIVPRIYLKLRAESH